MFKEMADSLRDVTEIEDPALFSGHHEQKQNKGSKLRRWSSGKEKKKVSHVEPSPLSHDAFVELEKIKKQVQDFNERYAKHGISLALDIWKKEDTTTFSIGSSNENPPTFQTNSNSQPYKKATPPPVSKRPPKTMKNQPQWPAVGGSGVPVLPVMRPVKEETAGERTSLSTGDKTSLSAGESTSFSAGDSGFVDVKRFLKRSATAPAATNNKFDDRIYDEPITRHNQPPVTSGPGYMKLIVKQEEVDEYAHCVPPPSKTLQSNNKAIYQNCNH